MDKKLWWQFSNFYASHTATDENHRVVFVITREVEFIRPRWTKKITRTLCDGEGKVLATGKRVCDLKVKAEELYNKGG